MDSYKTWYPTVQETLSCLGKLYRCVEARVFAGLAQDAVTACTSSVQVRLATRLAGFGSLPGDGLYITLTPEFKHRPKPLLNGPPWYPMDGVKGCLS